MLRNMKQLTGIHAVYGEGRERGARSLTPPLDNQGTNFAATYVIPMPGSLRSAKRQGSSKISIVKTSEKHTTN